MLLLEVLRRAAHDWILYRHSTRLVQLQIAEEAYHWIFSEEPGAPAWIERTLNKKELTSFVSICEVLSLDPDVVRAYVKRLTVKEILSTGRPPTYRRQKERRRFELPSLQPPEYVDVVMLYPTPPSSSPQSAPIQALFSRARMTVDSLMCLLLKKE